MATLTADKAMRAVLSQAYEPTEIRDESGTVLGLFVPAERQPRGKVRTPEEKAALLAELERRSNDPRPDRTFRQAFERLLSLATDSAQRNLIQEKINQLKE